MAKRFFDFLVAASLLIVLFPLLLCLAITVRLHLRSSVFFVQMRPGLHGKPFYMFKFRTMTNDRDAEGILLPDAQRLTRLGRFLRAWSLDELPELFNVIKGDMSLVGPRPLLLEYLPLYNPQQARRHQVKPGITGWAQVNGRNALTWEERFDLDVWYVQNHTFRLDLKIIWMTLRVVFKRQGISHFGCVTMEKFRGSTL
jgi:sugar transferase EpsL